ncbi:MAG: phosphate ABC transporter ATP-binding protein [Proteobacteria bacterium]|nr:phosphate ABC transporter ATP-binding protein [Pseudomonadota bacterium]
MSSELVDKPSKIVNPPSIPPTTDTAAAPMIEVDHVDFYYGKSKALHSVNLNIAAKQVTAFIGPSGCGKSTLLRCFNRMNDLIEGTRIGTGEIRIQGVNIYDPTVDVISLRRQVGMVFQKSNPFPKSIYQNISYGLELQGVKDKKRLDEVVEKSLRGAALWEEVKDRLHSSALGLSGGQQQRLCIARAIAVEPAVILMDEPCSSLDPLSTLGVESLIQELGKTTAIVVVTPSLQQAARISSRTAFIHSGRLIEVGATARLFTLTASQLL